MGFFSGILFAVAIVGAIAIGYVIFFNKLQTTNNKIEQAESIIDDTLRNKFDLLVKVSAIYKSYAKNTKEYFKTLDDVKDRKITNFDFDRKLTETFNTILELKNDIKDLQDDKDFKRLVNDIKEADEKLNAAKIYYNKYTNLQNELVRTFPSNVIGKIHGYRLRVFFDGKDMQDSVINDFKL